MDSGGGPGPPRPADSSGSHLQPSHDGYVELPQSNRITRLNDLNLSQSAHYGRAVSQQLPHQSYRSSNRSVLTSQSVSANAFHVPFPENSNLGLFPFNPTVAQQASQLGGQVPSNRGSADPSAQTSTPFSNLPYIPGVPQANPSVAIPLSHPQRVNPQTNMLHQINAAASVANHSAAMQAGNLPQNVQQQSTNDIFGELEKAFASKPRPTTSAAKGADVIDSALSMALPGPPASHQQAARVIGAQTQPQLQNARLQQQRLQQHLQLQEQFQQQLQQQQQQMRHPSAPHQSLLSRQQQQMHPYLQQTQLAPGQLNAGLHTHALRPNLAGQTSLPSRHVQQQSLPSGGPGLDSHGARRDGKTRRKQQTRRPRTGSGMSIPIVPGNQMPNALAAGSLTSAHQRQQIPILPGQLAFNSRQGRFQQNPLHLQQNPVSLQGALAQQPSTSGQVQGSVRSSIGAGSFPLSNTSSFMGSPTLQQQARADHNASQGGMQNISSDPVSGGKVPQRIPQGNPEMEKFDAATLQNVLRSSNDPNIKAAIQQQLEYLQYKAAMTATAQHRQTQPTQLSSGLGTNSQRLSSLPQPGDILNQNPSRVSQAAIMQRQKKLLQKQQLIRQQQQMQKQQMQQQQMQKQQMQQQQMQKQQMQQQQMQKQQMQQQQIQQQQMQQQQIQQQHMQQQHMQQQHLKQQHMQQQQIQQQQIQQQHQLQLRNQASLAQPQAPASGFPSQGLPGSRQAGGVSHRARDSNTLPSRLGNQVLAQQLQHSNRRAQHSQSSHSQSASQGAPSDLAGEGQHPSSQNSHRQSSTRRPRRSSRVARNEAEAANGRSGIAVDLPVHQGRITRPRVLTGQGAENHAQSDRLSRLDSSQIRKPGIHGLVQPPLTRSPAEAVEQAAQAAQLAAVRAASANLRTGDDKQAAEDRKRIGRETELSNIEEQKKRRLQTAPWNDYQRILAPDYTTPFSNVSDAWQRLVPYHVVLTDEDASVPQEEWDAEIDKLSKKYKDCFRSLRESFDRLFDAGFESIGSAAELPEYGSLCKDDSLILDSILLRDYYETARKQQALIAREKESRIAAEMERRRVTEMNRQRSMVQREELIAQNAMRMSAAQGRPLGSLPATHPHGPSISSGIAASGALPPPAGPGLLPTLNRRTEGLPAASSLSGAVDSGTKNSPSFPHAPSSQYNQKQGLLPPGASPSVSTAGLHPQANFGSHGNARYIPSISASHGVSHASNTGLGLNAQGMLNADFRETLKDPTSSSLAVSNAQGYAQPMGMSSQSIDVSNQTKAAGAVPNPAMYHRTTSNGPLSVGQQSAGTNANASDGILWSDGRVQQVNQSTGSGTRTVIAGSGEIVRNGMQETGQSGLPISNLHASTGRVSGSAPHAMGTISAAGMGMGGKPSGRTAHVSSLNGSHHETLKPKLPGLHDTNSGLIGGQNMTSFGRPLGGRASNASPYRNVEAGITSGQRGVTPHESGTSMGISGNMMTHGDVPNLQREAKAGPEKGNNSGVMGMDGRVGVLPNKANETGRQAKGAELGGLGMGSLLNADGS